MAKRTKAKFGGSMSQYRKVSAKLCEMGIKFDTRETLSSATIIFGNGDKQSFSDTSKEYSKYLYLCGFVKRDAQKYIEEKNHKAPTEPYNIVTSYYSNDLNRFENQDVSLTDIKKCYTAIAHQLGIIGDDTYKRLCDLPVEAKLMRQIALGSLSTSYRMKIFYRGKMTTKPVIRNQELASVHRLILRRAEVIMKDLIDLLKDDFIMWQTDCVYYSKERQADVHNYLTSQSLEYRDETATILDYDPELKILYWKNSRDSKNQKYAHVYNKPLKHIKQ